MRHSSASRFAHMLSLNILHQNSFTPQLACTLRCFQENMQMCDSSHKNMKSAFYLDIHGPKFKFQLSKVKHTCEHHLACLHVQLEPRMRESWRLLLQSRPKAKRRGLR